MAKKRSRMLHVPSINTELTVGALVSEEAVTALVANSVVRKEFLLSTKLTVALDGNNPADGPLLVGLAHSDYSTAEILEWINAQGAWDTGDLVAREQARRKVRAIGVFPGILASEVLNDGNPIKTTCKWTLDEGDTIKFWALNEDTDNRQGGGFVSFNGKAFLRA